MHDDCKLGSAALSRYALLLFLIGTMLLYAGSLVEQATTQWAKQERMNSLSESPLPDHREARKLIRLAVYAVYALGSVLVATGIVGWCAPARLRRLLSPNRPPRPVDSGHPATALGRSDDVHED